MTIKENLQKVVENIKAEQSKKSIALNATPQRLEACESAIADIALAVMSDEGNKF